MSLWKVEGGFQNFVLGHVFPEAETPTSTLGHEGGGGKCVQGELGSL